MSKLADTHSSGFDALDGFDLDDEFLDLDHGRPGPALTPPPAVASMSAPVEGAFVEATPPAVATPSALSPVSGAVEVAIPRIAVHVFAERQDTAAAGERAGQDRRMARA